jgi:hypothetical protein
MDKYKKTILKILLIIGMTIFIKLALVALRTFCFSCVSEYINHNGHKKSEFEKKIFSTRTIEDKTQ